MVLVCFGCGSKAEKTGKQIKNLTEEYIENIEKAKSKEEFRQLHKEYNDRIEFEFNKLSKEEMEEYEKNASWEEYQEFQNLNTKRLDAEDRMKKKFSNH